MWTEVDLDDPFDVQSKVDLIQNSFSKIKQWMDRNKLRINPSKTELLLLSPKSRRKPLPEINLILGGITITPSKLARNLGITLDSHLSFEKHIANVVKSCCIHLRNISSIRPYINQEATERLIHAFATSRVDFCNSIFIGLPKHLIRRLQKIQNWAAKLIYKQSKYTDVTPLLNTLHWLPIVKRIEFKVLIFVHGCIYNTTPTYMSELITTKNYTRDTRQSENITLLVPKTNISYGSRAFSVIGYGILFQII